MKMTLFICLRALPAWLALSRKERAEISENALHIAFAHDALTFRFFDAEAFSARVSDIAMIEAEQAENYYFAIERLRDTVLFSVPYFEMVEIIPAFENGFQAFEAAAGNG